MKKLKYFNECKSLDEVKAEYKRYVQRELPREGHAGDPNLLSSVDNEYYEISQRPKFKELTEEIREEFLGFPKIVKVLVRLGLVVEICGSWVWISGKTIDHKEQLKELGLRYSGNKKMWYYRPKWFRSTNSTPVDMEYIRKKWGTDADDGGFVFDQQYTPTAPTKQREGASV